MGGGQMETPARGQAQPGQDGRFATAAGTLSLSQADVPAKRVGLYQVIPEDGAPLKIEEKGREVSALDRLRPGGTHTFSRSADKACRLKPRPNRSAGSMRAIMRAIWRAPAW